MDDSRYFDPPDEEPACTGELYCPCADCLAHEIDRVADQAIDDELLK